MAGVWDGAGEHLGMHSVDFLLKGQKGVESPVHERVAWALNQNDTTGAVTFEDEIFKSNVQYGIICGGGMGVVDGFQHLYPTFQPASFEFDTARQSS